MLSDWEFLTLLRLGYLIAKVFPLSERIFDVWHVSFRRYIWCSIFYIGSNSRQRIPEIEIDKTLNVASALCTENVIICYLLTLEESNASIDEELELLVISCFVRLGC